MFIVSCVQPLWQVPLFFGSSEELQVLACIVIVIGEDDPVVPTL